MDFMYEGQLSRCPSTEEQAEAMLIWMGVVPDQAKKYYGLSSSRAILMRLGKEANRVLYPPQYRNIQERQ